MTRLAFALLLVGAIVWARALGGQFVWDDFAFIVLNEHLRSWQSLPVLLTSDMFRSVGVHVSDFYRPLTVLTFFVDHQIWGLRPFGYHLTNIVLHLATAIVMYRVWARLGSPDGALLGALVWVVHPVHVEAVAYIPSRGEILYTLWGLVAILLVLRGQEGWSLVALAAALLSKETAVIVPAILAVVGLARGWTRAKLARYLGACALVVLGYVLLRLSLGMALTIAHGRDMPAAQRGLLALKALATYGQLLVWPADLLFPRAVTVPADFWDAAVLAGVLGLASGLGLTALAWTRWPAVAVGLAWFFLGLLPHSNLILLNVPLAEHWLYFPAVGLCGAAGLGALAAARRLGKVPVALAVGLAVALLSVRTVAGIADWRDEITVALKATRGNPESLMAWRALGSVRARRGELVLAVAAYERALALDPRDLHARRYLGQVLFLSGRHAEAERHLRIAAGVDQQGAWTPFMLGEVLYAQQRVDEAVAYWKDAVARDPLFGPARQRLREVAGEQ